MKVFVSGSRELNDVEKAKKMIPELLEQCLEDRDIILVGDAPGFDTLVQEYLHLKGYNRVLVYYVGEKPRNNIGGFRTHGINANQRAKDALMAHHCDVGLCYWNGTSQGTKINMDRLERMEKPCKVIVEEPKEESDEEERSMVDIKPSAKMKKGIKLIEQTLRIKYTGKTFDEAKKFLDENLPKLDGIDFRTTREPSEKQLKGVHFIESMLNIEFEGKSMKDASDFLDKYFEEAKEKSEHLKERKRK